MQEEITKHTKKIYHAMKDPDHGFWAKTKEVAIEILIIVFAVTLSIWLHSWSDHRHEQKETTEFLKGLRDDLSKDIEVIEENKKDIARVDVDFKYLMALNDSNRIDTASESTIMHRLFFALRVTHPNIGRYEGFKSSGKIGTIENDSLKQSILVYYQQTIPGLQDGESTVNTFQTQILGVELDKTDKMTYRDLAKSYKMRAFLQITTQNLDGNIDSYTDAENQAKKITSLIDRQSRD